MRRGEPSSESEESEEGEEEEERETGCERRCRGDGEGERP